MLDIKGPGTVYCIWTTGFGGSDVVKAYIDGETVPRLNMTIANLFAGTNAPLHPSCGRQLRLERRILLVWSRSFDSSIKITATGSAFYHRISHIHAGLKGDSMEHRVQRLTLFKKSGNQLEAIPKEKRQQRRSAIPSIWAPDKPIHYWMSMAPGKSFRSGCIFLRWVIWEETALIIRGLFR